MGLLDTIKNTFRKKQHIRAYIIDEVGRIHKKDEKYENNRFATKIGGEAHAYIVDMNHVVYDKDNVPVSLYYSNNPSPLPVRHQRNRDLDSVGFKKLLDDKTIQELFDSQAGKKMTLLIILVIANLALTLLVGLVSAGILKIPRGG